MRTYEHFVTTLPGDCAEIATILDEMGEQGWELLGVAEHRRPILPDAAIRESRFIFRRPFVQGRP